MTYDEAVEKINSLLVFGSRPGLERVRELVDRIGAPDKKLKFVHIAGTNGKGSVCAFLSSVLRQAGYKTGLFISPYVLEFRERFQINGEMIPEQALAEIIEELWDIVAEMKDEGKIITEFELVLAAGLKWFEREKCDVVVLETGLGGRFDATNIIDTPLASVIMSVSLDHTAILGDTVEKIAFEKCGIIKPDGVTVLYGDQPDGVFKVVRQIADNRNNRLIIADTASAVCKKSGLEGSVFSFTNELLFEGMETELYVPLIGAHQIKNAAAALFTAAVLRDRGLSISDGAIIEGLSHTAFPARAELLGNEPVVLLDGAHNPGGAAALSELIRTQLDGRYKVAVTGMLADKDIRTALSCLVPLFDRVMAVSPDNPRAMSAEGLAEIVSGYGIPVEAEHDLRAAYRKALGLAQENGGAVVVFGSLYLASDMRKIIIEEK